VRLVVGPETFCTPTYGHLVPLMVFPMFIVRANAAAPDTVYHSNSSVVLSPTVSLPNLRMNFSYIALKDSMIYHWRANSSWPMCYLTAWVSSPTDLLSGHKSYRAEGNVTGLEIWNVSAPTNRNALKSMSWNTRPARLSLLGTVDFTDQRLDAQELKPPTPRFPCLGDTEITVEVVCSACQIEFEQVFSMPPLGSSSADNLRVFLC
jgi:hypothetical protein